MLVLCTSTFAAWTLLNDTDWPRQNCKTSPYGKGKSASDCADQCQKRLDCVAVSWNSPTSSPKDSACNFKCHAEGQHTDKGEVGVVVRPGKNLCNEPPPAPTPKPAPTPATLCPINMPLDWHSRCTAGHLFFSGEGSGGLIPEVGNGYVATHANSDTIYAAGLFNGDAMGVKGPTSHRYDNFNSFRGGASFIGYCLGHAFLRTQLAPARKIQS